MRTLEELMVPAPPYRMARPMATLAVAEQDATTSLADKLREAGVTPATAEVVKMPEAIEESPGERAIKLANDAEKKRDTELESRHADLKVKGEELSGVAASIREVAAVPAVPEHAPAPVADVGSETVNIKPKPSGMYEMPAEARAAVDRIRAKQAELREQGKEAEAKQWDAALGKYKDFESKDRAKFNAEKKKAANAKRAALRKEYDEALAKKNASEAPTTEVQGPKVPTRLDVDQMNKEANELPYASEERPEAWKKARDARRVMERANATPEMEEELKFLHARQQELRTATTPELREQIEREIDGTELKLDQLGYMGSLLEVSSEAPVSSPTAVAPPEPEPVATPEVGDSTINVKPGEKIPEATPEPAQEPAKDFVELPGGTRMQILKRDAQGNPIKTKHLNEPIISQSRGREPAPNVVELHPDKRIWTRAEENEFRKSQQEAVRKADEELARRTVQEEELKRSRLHPTQHLTAERTPPVSERQENPQEARIRELERQLTELRSRLGSREQPVAGEKTDEQVPSSPESMLSDDDERGPEMADTPGDAERALAEIEDVKMLGEDQEPSWWEQQGVSIESGMHDVASWWHGVWAKRAKDRIANRTKEIQKLEKEAKKLADSSWRGAFLSPFKYGARISWHKWRRDLIEATHHRRADLRSLHEDARNELFNGLAQRLDGALQTHIERAAQYERLAAEIDDIMEQVNAAVLSINRDISQEKDSSVRQAHIEERTLLWDSYKDAGNNKHHYQQILQQENEKVAEVRNLKEGVLRNARTPDRPSTERAPHRESLQTRQKRPVVAGARLKTVE